MRINDFYKSMPPEDVLSKLKAVLVHAIISLAISIVCAVVIFLVWFPDPFYTMLGGLKLFMFVLFSNAIVGPLISLVIYSSKKNSKTLIKDYLFFGIIQILALAYGMYTIAMSRPVYVAFAVDGFEVILASDLKDEDLAKARDRKWRVRGWSGPSYVWARMPEDAQKKTELIFDAMNGKDIQFQPKFYDDISKAKSEMIAKTKSIDELINEYPERAEDIVNILKSIKIPINGLVWLPVRSANNYWAVLMNQNVLMPVEWISLE